GVAKKANSWSSRPSTQPKGGFARSLRSRLTSLKATIGTFRRTVGKLRWSSTIHVRVAFRSSTYPMGPFFAMSKSKVGLVSETWVGRPTQTVFFSQVYAQEDRPCYTSI